MAFQFIQSAAQPTLQHIEFLTGEKLGGQKSLLRRLTGRYFTPELIGRHLVRGVIEQLDGKPDLGDSISVIDPFGGDGRLIRWLIEEWSNRELPSVRWDVTLWDLDVEVQSASAQLTSLGRPGSDVDVIVEVTDTFVRAADCSKRWDLVITNPPWELLKPDPRDLEVLGDDERTTYIGLMRSYDRWLSEHYALSQPQSKYAGWGTNLSRVGLEVCLRLAASEAVIGAVLPASFYADEQSRLLRAEMLVQHRVAEIGFFPAEARLFNGVDVQVTTSIFTKNGGFSDSVVLSSFSKDHTVIDRRTLSISHGRLKQRAYVLPISFGSGAIELLDALGDRFSTFADLESDAKNPLWAGRELDETGSREWLDSNADDQNPFFARGRMVSRYHFDTTSAQRVVKKNWNRSKSTFHRRIAWRDVSRPNQKRRVIATIIETGWVTGNSLGVAYFPDSDVDLLEILLGVINSTSFEFQLRAHLATGHISLSALRKVRIPDVNSLKNHDRLRKLVILALAGKRDAEIAVDAYVAAHVYKWNGDQYATILNQFPKITAEEKSAFLAEFRSTSPSPDEQIETIANHRTASLSELDMKMVISVPEGGNWKNIPLDIPSKRLDQIREGFRQGKGSRSTYYGRLDRHRPSYTINTHFGRPGNGCHIHYQQNRVISQREAARLQSFPDNFRFYGPQTIVNQQIGNAVPPLLAYQIARSLGEPGAFIDLFAGAGGLGLGFKWAGWRPIVANDIESRYLETYRDNVHGNVLLGSITDRAVRSQLIAEARKAKQSGSALWLLGGPPCQGFSTAGRRRSMDDQRNHLVWDYQQLLEEIGPEGFVFENVTGLLNMQGGQVFSAIKQAFATTMPNLVGLALQSDHYGIPQRRKRVFLVGRSNEQAPAWEPPPRITTFNGAFELFGRLQPAVSVEEAIADLPPLRPGEDGSCKAYLHRPTNRYQKLMRNVVTPEQYVDSYLTMVDSAVNR